MTSLAERYCDENDLAMLRIQLLLRCVFWSLSFWCVSIYGLSISEHVLFVVSMFSFVAVLLGAFSIFCIIVAFIDPINSRSEYRLYLLLQENVLKLPESSREAVLRSRRNYLKTRGITVFNGGEV